MKPSRDRPTPWLASIYPAAFAAGYVLISFSTTPTPVGGLWRPLLAAIVIAAAVSVLFGLAFRNRSIGALVASIVVLLLAAPWLALVLSVIAAPFWLGIGVLRRRRAGQTIAPVTSRLPVIAVMFALVTAVTAIPAAFASLNLDRPASTAAAAGERTLPNIYALLLDGYPRSDVLEAELGMDNRPFEEELEGLDFEVAADSQSNYTSTWASLTALFHGRYLHELPELTPFPRDQAEQFYALMRSMNRGGILDELRAAGYRVATVPPPFESASLFTADEVRPTGHMTSFELSLIQHSPIIGVLLAIAPDTVLDQQRQRVESALHDLEAIATEPSDRPVFAFVHVLSPHAPIVFDADGELPPLPSCFPQQCSLWEIASADQWRMLPAQIDQLNRRVIDTLESVVGSDPDAVVLVMSDHGVQRPGGDLATMLKNFTALRAPGASGLLGDRPHTVNILAAIAQQYAGIPATRRDYEGWVSAPEHPLTMQPAP
jgi:hypothetical protein